MAEYRQDWANSLVRYIENNLELIKHGKVNDTDFLDDPSTLDTDLYNSKNNKETQLFCLYQFAESYFFAIVHQSDHEEDVGGVPIHIAEDILKECVDKLKRGEKIDNPEVLEYSKYQYTMIDHLKQRIRALFHKNNFR